MAKHRIVSLLPSCTEIACALGLEKQLVGRSHECDFPKAVHKLPTCTKANVNSEASSKAIDDQVKDLLQNSLSLYDIDLEQLRALKPSVVLTQAQCDVCAVSEAAVEDALGDWTGERPKIISLSPKRFTDLWENMLTVAYELGITDEAKGIVKALKLRCVDVIEKACQIDHKPSVATVEWVEPLMAAGNWTPDLVELAGGQSLFGDSGKHSPYLNWEAIREHDPEVIIVMVCGFDIERTIKEMPALTAMPDWQKLRAVKKGRVFITDGNQFFNRPGPRLVESLEILAEIMHPGKFPPKYEGKGWVLWEG